MTILGLKTEFISSVQGQCAPGTLPPPASSGVAFAGEPLGVLQTAPLVVAAPNNAMNQLGTVYATKRRRRNGKRYVNAVLMMIEGLELKSLRFWWIFVVVY